MFKHSHPDDSPPPQQPFFPHYNNHPTHSPLLHNFSPPGRIDFGFCSSLRHLLHNSPSVQNGFYPVTMAPLSLNIKPAGTTSPTRAPPSRSLARLQLFPPHKALIRPAPQLLLANIVDTPRINFLPLPCSLSESPRSFKTLDTLFTQRL